MNFKFSLVVLIVIVFVAGCSSYQENDFRDSNTVLLDEKMIPQCIHMEQNQQAECIGKQKGTIGFAGGNCDSPYEYQRVKCEKDKAEQKALLKESLQKHIKQ